MSVPDPAAVDWVPIFSVGTPTGAPFARVYRTTNQTVPNATWTQMTHDAVVNDNNAHYSAANPTRLTCKVAGTYVIEAQEQIAAAAGGGWRMIAIKLNGTIYLTTGPYSGVTFGTAGAVKCPITTTTQLQVGDYVEVWGYQDSGASQPFYGGDLTNNDNSHFSMALVGASAQGPPGTPGAGIPTPVVNGQWIKGSGGAAVWSAISDSDVPALAPNSGRFGPTGMYPMPGNDWNQAINNGVYMSPDAANAPGGGWWIGSVTQHNPSWVQQRVTRFTDGAGVPAIYYRRCLNGSWDAWRPMYDGNNAYSTGYPVVVCPNQNVHLDTAYVAQTVPAEGAVGVWWYFSRAGPTGGACVVTAPSNMAYFHISAMSQATTSSYTNLVLSNDVGTPQQDCTNAAIAYIA